MLTIYGASDDLIEVEGDITEEFPAITDESSLLAFSDGTLLRVRYDEDGLWRITPLAKGTATLSITPATDPDSANYSDRATLEGAEFTWVAHASAYAKP